VIAELATDLLTKVRSVDALALYTSLTLGGKKDDPGLLKCPLPAAWVKFGKDGSDERDRNYGPESGLVSEAQLMMAEWLVTVLVPYTTDDDLLLVQYPLLEAITTAVHAQDSPSGLRWRYAGQRIALVYTDRLAYEQRYTVNLVTQL
jgi:hypothetical protein